MPTTKNTGSENTPPESTEPQVALRVVRGEADATELAALITVLASRSVDAPAAPAQVRSRWASPSRQVRPSLRPGPSGWRSSALPR